MHLSICLSTPVSLGCGPNPSRSAAKPRLSRFAPGTVSPPLEASSTPAAARHQEREAAEEEEAAATAAEEGATAEGALQTGEKCVEV